MAQLVKSSQRLEHHGTNCFLDESYVEATSEEVKELLKEEIVINGWDEIPETLYMTVDHEEVEILVDEYLSDEDREELEQFIATLE